MTNSAHEGRQRASTFNVVATVTQPGIYDTLPQRIRGEVLGLRQLSVRYPRSRNEVLGGLIIAQYGLETGIYDSEQITEHIESVDGGEVVADPRLFDDELGPDALPDDYQLGEGYTQWQARINPHLQYEDVSHGAPFVGEV